MLKNFSAAFLLASAGIIGTAGAADFGYAVNNETGSAYRGPEYAMRDGKVVRTDVQASQRAVGAPRADANWKFVAGETGWQPATHRFVVAKGVLAHSEECDHTVRPAPTVTAADIEAARRQWPGG